MKKLLILCISALPVRAADLTLKDGTVLKSYSVIRQDTSSLRIEHSEGVSKVPVENLPADLVAKYQWDGRKIEDEKSAEAKKREVEARDLAAVDDERRAIEEDAAYWADREATAKAAEDERAVEMRRAARSVGPFKMWVSGVEPAKITKAGEKVQGHRYRITINGEVPNKVKVGFSGAVLTESGNSDAARDARVTLRGTGGAGATVESIIPPTTPGGVTVAVRLKVGSKVYDAKLPVPASAIKLPR